MPDRIGPPAITIRVADDDARSGHPAGPQAGPQREENAVSLGQEGGGGCVGVGERVRLQPHAGPAPQRENQALVDFIPRRPLPPDDEGQQHQRPKPEAGELHPRGEKHTRCARQPGDCSRCSTFTKGKAQGPQGTGEDEEEDRHGADDNHAGLPGIRQAVKIRPGLPLRLVDPAARLIRHEWIHANPAAISHRHQRLARSLRPRIRGGGWQNQNHLHLPHHRSPRPHPADPDLRRHAGCRRLRPLCLVHPAVAQGSAGLAAARHRRCLSGHRGKPGEWRQADDRPLQPPRL